MLDGFGAFIVSVAESKRIWQSCQLRCGCYFLLTGPMICQSYSQIMFVNYMPFLILGYDGRGQIL